MNDEPIRLPAYRSLYTAFDRFPSSKGAATHIAHASMTLAETVSPSLLFCLGDETLSTYEAGENGAADMLRFSEPIPNFLRRTMAYAQELEDVVDELADSLALCHFRDPWGGVPISARADRGYGMVYEVNGLPSVELPYHYPAVRADTLAMIARKEDFCLSQADQLIVPSGVIQQNLMRRGVAKEKITVVPNGAIIHPQAPRPVAAPERYVLYFGAVQPWQGVPVLLRAFSRLQDLDEVTLVICSSVKPKATRNLHRLARRLGIADRVHWEYQLDKPELEGWLQHAECSVAPLTECSRNLIQGCCPLKILESLAAGTPVIASDLPVVRELLKDGETGRLIQAGRVNQLALAVRHMLEDRDYARKMGEQGKAHVSDHFTWEHALAKQRAVYQTVLGGVPERI